MEGEEEAGEEGVGDCGVIETGGESGDAEVDDESG